MKVLVSRNGWWAAWPALGLAAVLGIYALLGFVLAPLAAQAWLWPWLSERLGGRFAAEAVAFNPFSFSARVKGFSWHGPDGAALAQAREVWFDADLPASLAARAPVGSIRLAGPSLRVAFDARGRANYAFVLAAPPGPDSGPWPFLLRELRVEDGRLAFEDRSRGKGFKTVLSPLSLRLENLGPDSEARFALAARGAAGESLALEGGVRLGRAEVEGTARAEGLRLGPLAAWLAEGPYALEGAGAFEARFRLGPRGLELSEGRARAAPLALLEDGRPWLRADALAAAGLALPPGGARLEAAGLELAGLALRGEVRADAASARARGLAFDVAGSRLAVDALEAAALKLGWGGQDAAAVGGLSARGLDYGFDGGRLGLAALRLEAVELLAPSPLADRQGQALRFQAGALALGGLALDPARRLAEAESARVEGAVFGAWLERDGSAGFGGLPPPAAPEQGPPAPPWRLALGLAELDGARLLLRDFRVEPPAALRLEPLNLRVESFDSAPGRPFRLRLDSGVGAAGRLALAGQVRLSPPAANLGLHAEGFPLAPLQPYLNRAARFRVVRGRLSAAAELDYDEAAGRVLRVAGDVAVADFASVERDGGRDFVKWKNLRLDGLVFEDDGALRLGVKQAAAEAPYARVVLGPGEAFNLAENFTPPAAPPPAAGPPPPQPAPPPGPGRAAPAKGAAEIAVGVLRIRGGALDFADLGVKPFPFAVNIQGLGGVIRSLSSRPDARADVLLEGRLEQDATVRIAGHVNPFSPRAFTDLALQFRGVNLATLSPYSAKFAGYRIERGRLSMDLRYRLDGGRLEAENQFVLDHLDLGERVESKDAADLPLKLAVALLKDGEGRIEADLPVAGDLANPAVSLRSLLAGAAKQFFAKLLGSPFALLGSLAGVEGGDLGAVAFAPGEAALPPAEKDKLAAVARALQIRPGLGLDVRGQASAALDGPALAEKELARRLEEARRSPQEDDARLLTRLYRWQNPGAPELRGLPPGGALAGEALAEARRRLLAGWAAGEAELRALARARAGAVRDHLVGGLGLAGERIYLPDVRLAGEGGGPGALLSLGAP